MNLINPKSPNIILAKNNHFEKLKPLVIARIKRNIPVTNSRLKSFLIDNLKDILVGSPNVLKDLSKEIISVRGHRRYKKNIPKIFSYENFKKNKKYNAYSLATILDQQTCVYCNRLYTKTVSTSDKSITRPQFDHWFSQTDYPLLSISFFNLIPSCRICNSDIKGAGKMSLKYHLHPYLSNKVNYNYSYVLDKYNVRSFKLRCHNSKSRRTVKFFALEDIYKEHISEIDDLVSIKKKYSTNYLKNLKSILKSGGVTNDEIYRLAFGTYIDESKFSNRPLSRLKRDILKELGII